jgi:hypothetical protein
VTRRSGDILALGTPQAAGVNNPVFCPHDYKLFHARIPLVCSTSPTVYFTHIYIHSFSVSIQVFHHGFS